MHPPSSNPFSRRRFIQTSALAGAALLAPAVPAQPIAGRRTAADQVNLGRTGLKLSRLGMGTGSNNGHAQAALGREGMTSLMHYAYDNGITYFDAAEAYVTYPWIGSAIRGLPREKIFLQSKVKGKPSEILAAIDRQRKNFNTDYVDSLLIHCMTHDHWTDDFQRMMEGFDQAKEKKWILAKGVSCHSLPALRAATAADWTDVHLVRVNPQGRHTDGEVQESWSEESHPIDPVMGQIKLMHQKGHGIIGMKIIGNGEFTNPADREKSIRYAMACKEIDAVVIGFTSREQIDEAIGRINRALAGAA